jgi:hypothetical protein
MSGIDDGPSVGELARQVQEVLSRFTGLATRLETQFVRSDNFELYKELVKQAFKALETTMALLARSDRVEELARGMEDKADNEAFKALVKRVSELEDDKKWLTRLIIGFIILAILGAIFYVSQKGGVARG